MKIFLCAIIAFFSGLIGINIKNAIYKKYQLFAEINAFLHFISIKIAFFQDVYADCLNNFIQTNQLKNKEFFAEICSLIKNSNLSKENVLKSLKNLGLTADEQVEIYNIFASIGTTDITNQKQILQGNINQIEHKLNVLNQLKKTKGDVASKLSICIGLIICILIY